jgi:putative (di)nucleoside polyphosphate hydrolase
MGHRDKHRDPSTLPYRPCVGVMLLNRNGRVFVGRRRAEAGPEHVDGGHAWQMPQGGIDAGETPYDAALRELAEETSVTTVTFAAEAPDWLSYDLPPVVIGRAWKGRYRGQTQKWFAFRFDGDESEIDIETPVGGHKAEFDAWRWVTMAELPGLIIPFKRPVYEQVVAAFAHLARP